MKQKTSKFKVHGTRILFILVTIAPNISLGDTLNTILMMTPKYSSAELTHTSEVVQGLLSDLPVIFRVEHVEEMESDLAFQVQQAKKLTHEKRARIVFWIDSTVTNRVILYFSVMERERILIREIGEREEGGEARDETIGLIIRATIKTILEGKDIGTHPPKPPEEKEKASSEQQRVEIKADESEKVRGVLLTQVTYLVSPSASDGVLAHGPALSLLVAPIKEVRIFLSYRFIYPIKVIDLVSLQLESHPLELGARYAWQWHRFSIGIGLSCLMDWISAFAYSSEPGFKPQQDIKTVGYFGLAPSLWVSVRLNNITNFVATVAADIYFWKTDFIVDVPAGGQSVLELWPVRPLFQLGLNFTII